MMNQSVDQATINLSDILKKLKSNIKVSLLILAFPFVLAVLYLQIVTDKYTAELKIVPTEGDGASLSSDIGGLASFAGINLKDSETVSNYRLYLDTLHSRRIAIELAKDQELMQTIFAEHWNEDMQKWQNPKNSFIYKIPAFVKKVLGIYNREWNVPSAWNLEEFLTDYVEISENPKEAVITILFMHEDPEFAKDFLIKLHSLSDNLIRNRTLERSKNHAEYLKKKLQTVSVAEHRQALTISLVEQERFIMLASSNKAFAAEALWGVKSSPEPTSPKPILVILFSLIFSTVLISAYGFVLTLKE